MAGVDLNQRLLVWANKGDKNRVTKALCHAVLVIVKWEEGEGGVDMKNTNDIASKDVNEDTIL